MTSKSLFSNSALVWDAIRRKIWLFILSILGFFFALPVAAIMIIQEIANLTGPSVKETAISTLQSFLGPFSPGTIIIMSVLGLMSALVFFGYMHKKRQVDFYYRLPISRTKMFWVNYIAGAVSIILPFILFFLSAVFIVGVFGGLEYLRKMVVLQGLVVPIIYFLAIYSITVLAGVLTGNIVLQAAVAGYIMALVPVILAGYNMLMDAFLITYAGSGPVFDTASSFSSPVLLVLYSYYDIAYGVTPWSN
ncbi:MAG: hypothetical protein Q4C00_02690, partial [Bacillota bacterium]|nr:hypothetical protein [Bacillota bacterium]